MQPDRRAVDAAIDHAAMTIRMWHDGDVAERDVAAAIRYALLALESYLDRLRREG
jgi:hypothetical protein